MTSLSLRLLERDLLPDAVIRFGIRRLLAGGCATSAGATSRRSRPA